MKVCELKYALKEQSMLHFGKHGKAINEIYDARGILSDPWGIAVTKYYIYVTDIIPSNLYRFSDYKLLRVKEEGKLANPHGLCVDYNGDVYVADCLNNRVCIFSESLQFLKCFGAGELFYTGDVKVTPDCIIVLDRSTNCIHFYSRCGDLINSCVSTGKHGIVFDTWFFCLDPLGNILLTDSINHAVKIISPSGQLTQTIMMDKYEDAWGICMSELGIIFFIARNGHYCLHSF
ncbi:hypothetical protein LOD99_9480 [Oopsacas minuta]|uniref:Uncharacterized protein n=1 Tax=Oopsacas minuta TaxID=111878 RepID=A0AAV7JC95_9METZ|nr:hypothetical protein LOD99_9480 [Oopsacas minuta]